MMSCDGYFCKLLTRGFPNYVTFCGVGVDVLQGGSNKPISWSVESVRFLAPLWEDSKNIHLLERINLFQTPTAIDKHAMKMI